MPPPRQKKPGNLGEHEALAARLWNPTLADDVLAWVRYVWPWGEPDTVLHAHREPKRWQCEMFDAISQHIADNHGLIDLGLMPRLFQGKVCSGRGIGKSAAVAMLTHWMLSTRVGSMVIVTANTEPQLKSKTWAELSKWASMAINEAWFDLQALSYRPAVWFEELVRRQLRVATGYYYAMAQLWDEDNPDAFAGAHNSYGMMVIFDEASGIPSNIHTVTEGFFTDPTPSRFWLSFSNGRRNQGDFYEGFHANRPRMDYLRNIDARQVEGVDAALLQEIADKWGEESDTTKTEVRGLFPSKGTGQFMSPEHIDGAMLRELPPYLNPHEPLLMGVDIARFGDDASVIRWRKGRDARIIPAQKFRGLDTTAMADQVADWINATQPARGGVAIDAGAGAGVIDILRSRGYEVLEVPFSGTPRDLRWADKRTELYGLLDNWNRTGCLPNDSHLAEELKYPLKKYFGDRMRLESKDDMKRRAQKEGARFASPDDADALALTFEPIVANTAPARGPRPGQPVASGIDYDVYSLQEGV